MEKRLGFFTGMFVGMMLPLFLLGGEFTVDKRTEITESFYGGLILGVLTDVALVVALIFLFK